jgi:protein-tyrosine phosphatase
MLLLSDTPVIVLLVLGFQGVSSLVPIFSISASPSSSSSLVPQKARYNFGPASSRDRVLYTAERPGNPQGRNDKVEDAKVMEWIEFIRGHKVSRVLALLDDDELANYEPSGLLNIYKAAGLECLVQPMGRPMAAGRILSWIEDAERCGERVVSHCTGGVGRCGRVAAAWLVHRYSLTPEQATDEVLQQALVSGVNRKGDPALLQEWLEAGLKP